MDQFKLITQHSPWFIPLCLLAGLGYAWFLYQKKGPWSIGVNRLLFSFRFLLVSMICFLLLGPLMKLFRNYEEKPALVIALDNSQSVPFGTDSAALKNITARLATLSKELQKEGIEMDVQLLDGSSSIGEMENIPFSNTTTNLNQMLNQVQSNYENRNLAGVVMISDGIYNVGVDPVFDEYSFPIYSLGLGDTVPKRDINVKNLIYNKIAYAGNSFPVIVELQSTGYSGKIIKLNLKQGGKTIATKNTVIKSDSEHQEIEFRTSSEKTGMQHYVVEAEPVSGEFTRKNNVSHAYIDIIEARERVLVVAPAPHPDIKALRSAIEQKENYEFILHIPGINELKQNKYDLVIFHQMPDLYGRHTALVEKLMKESKAHFFILGSQTNIYRLNQLGGLLQINARPNQKDQVTPSWNKTFDKFEMTDEDVAIMRDYPPLSVPFGTYTVKPDADIMLFQNIGNIQSGNPLLVTGTLDNKKTAILAGEGIWTWRLMESKEKENSQVFDKLFTNIIQYLSAQEDKRKFRMYPIVNEFNVTDRVFFEAELYNDIYEKIYDKKITLSIKDEEGKQREYSFVNSPGGSRLEIKGLGTGVYTYTGSVQSGGKTATTTGEFIITEQILEAINTTANHGLLRELSRKTGAEFFLPTQLEELSSKLKSLKAKNIIHSNEEMREFIHLPWIFFMLLFMISLEWGIRKYSGGY